MYLPSKYDSVYPFSYMFTYFVTVPHAFLTQLAFPIGNAQQGSLNLPDLHAACTTPNLCSVVRLQSLLLLTCNVSLFVCSQRLWRGAKEHCQGCIHHPHGHS